MFTQYSQTETNVETYLRFLLSLPRWAFILIYAIIFMEIDRHDINYVNCNIPRFLVDLLIRQPIFRLFRLQIVTISIYS